MPVLTGPFASALPPRHLLTPAHPPNNTIADTNLYQEAMSVYLSGIGKDLEINILFKHWAVGSVFSLVSFCKESVILQARCKILGISEKSAVD